MAKLANDEIVTRVMEDVRAAEEVRDQESVDNAEKYKYYRAKKMGNEETGRSQIVDTTVFETIEWVLPAIMDHFDEANGNPTYEPVGPEDEAAAEGMTNLVRYQFWRQNEGELELAIAVKDALMYHPGGVIKYWWEKKDEQVTKSYQDLTAEQVSYLSDRSNVTITGMNDSPYGYDVDVLWNNNEFDGPRFEAVSSWDFLRHPNATKITESPFVAHVVEKSGSDLREAAENGMYDKAAVERVLEGTPTNEWNPDYAETRMYAEDNLAHEVEPSKDPARQTYKLYECYVRLDTDGDGILESRLITICSKELLRNEINEYGHPPFVLLRPILDPHKFSGVDLAEMVLDLQRLRTELLRQAVNNQFQAGNSRKVIDPTSVNMADVMLNIPGAPIRVKPGVDTTTAVHELTTTLYNEAQFTFLAMCTELAEQRTGVTKVTKGVGDKFNETATGMLAAANQASIRVKQIAKTIAYGLKDLFRAFVFMNKKFLTQDVPMRLENKWYAISPDDLEGRMDLVLKIASGVASRQQEIMNSQQLLAVGGQLNAQGIPCIDAKVAKNIWRNIVKNMGIVNVDEYVSDAFLELEKEVSGAITANSLTGGGNGVGGETVGSLASAGTGAGATTNPAGAGSPVAAIQPGAGSETSFG